MQECDLLCGLDALVTARPVGPLVSGPGREVGCCAVLHEHGKWSLFVVREATGPLNCAFAGIVVPTSPNSKPNVHGRLGVVQSIAPSVAVLQSADQSTIDPPFEALLGPVCGVVVIISLRLPGDRVPNRSIETSLVAFSKIVRLHVRIVAS